MVKIPFRSSRERELSDGQGFKPEPHELEVLEPFLCAKQSLFSDVSNAVLGDGRIPDERRDPLLKFYKDQRSKQIAEGDTKLH